VRPGLVATIHGPVGKAQADAMHAELQKMEATMQVMTLGSAPKRKYEEPVEPYTISFSERDLDGLQFPHDDALVLEISIDDVDVRRILVDHWTDA